jgi:hypothetical protein
LADNSKFQLTIEKFSGRFKTSADDLKLPAGAEKFRNFGGFSAKGLKCCRQTRASRRKAQFSAERLTGVQRFFCARDR